MIKRQTKQHMGSLLALLLFAVFAVCILSVLMTGAGVYQRLSQRDDDAYTRRTATQYVSTKVRQAENSDAIRVEDFDGVPALTLRQDLGGVVLLTQIYCHDGWLRELFHLEGSGLIPSDGEKVLPMQAMSVEQKGSLLFVRLTDAEGQEQLLTLSLRRGEEGAS